MNGEIASSKLYTVQRCFSIRTFSPTSFPGTVCPAKLVDRDCHNGRYAMRPLKMVEGGIEVKQSLNRGNISGGFKVIHFDSDLCAVTRELAVVL